MADKRLPQRGSKSGETANLAWRLAEPAPRVSIIIPAYNAAATLEKAVASALGQTEPSMEVIVVDDASTDATWTIALRLASADARLRVERLGRNGGKAHAMNFATELARGTWIALLDADDWYAPTRIERLVTAAETEGVEMAADNLYFVDSHARLCTGTGVPFEGAQRLVDLDVFLRMSDPTARYDYGMLQPVFRADFVRRQALDYYEHARIGEDFYQLLCFFEAGGRGVVLDAPLYFYVEPFGAISRRWAQPTRSRYRFESMLETHRHFAAVLGPRLDAEHRRLLDRRGAGIEAMALLHQLHESLTGYELLGTLRRVLRMRPAHWTVAGKKLLARLRTVIVPKQGDPIPEHGSLEVGAAAGPDWDALPVAPTVRNSGRGAVAGAIDRTLVGYRAARG